MNTENWELRSMLAANTCAIGCKQQEMEVFCQEWQVLSALEDHFGNRTFLRHQNQGFEQFPTVNSYKTEEETFLKTVKIVLKHNVSHGANAISSHTLYKIKKAMMGHSK